jgi:hypothetical protein
LLAACGTSAPSTSSAPSTPPRSPQPPDPATPATELAFSLNGPEALSALFDPAEGARVESLGALVGDAGLLVWTCGEVGLDDVRHDWGMLHCAEITDDAWRDPMTRGPIPDGSWVCDAAVTQCAISGGGHDVVVELGGTPRRLRTIRYRPGECDPEALQRAEASRWLCVAERALLGEGAPSEVVDTDELTELIGTFDDQTGSVHVESRRHCGADARARAAALWPELTLGRASTRAMAARYLALSAFRRFSGVAVCARPSPSARTAACD